MGSRAQNVMPPARNPRPARAASRCSFRNSRATSNGTGRSKPEAVCISLQARHRRGEPQHVGFQGFVRPQEVVREAAEGQPPIAQAAHLVQLRGGPEHVVHEVQKARECLGVCPLGGIEGEDALEEVLPA